MDRSLEQIKSDMLENIPNTEDKSENSFVHDALAPTSIELFTIYRELEAISDKIDIENREGRELEQSVYPFVQRRPATYSSVQLRINGQVGTTVEEGTVAQAGDINFVIQETRPVGEQGYIEVEAVSETAGSAGNVPSNTIDSFAESNPGLTSVVNLMPSTGGYDEENDEGLLERYYEKVRTPSTSGNEYDYVNWAKEVEGIGDAKVFSLWNGNGTVKITIVDGNKLPASVELINKVSNNIEEKRPIGADVTVLSATAKNISVRASVTVADGHRIQDINNDFKTELEEYRKSIVFKESYLSYAAIGNILFSTEGVLDYTDLKVNNGMKNVALASEEVPLFDVVELEVT